MFIVLGTAGGGLLYVKNLQANLAISKANAVLMEEGIEKQKVLLAQQMVDSKALAVVVEEQYALIDKERKETEFLRQRFKKTNADGKVRDLGDLANNRPATVTKILNNDFNNQIRCNAIAQGSPLTEEETAVVKKTDPGYNSMCQVTANPNYVEVK